MVSRSVTAEVPVTLTEGEANVQVAPVGQPLATVRLTLPVNPPNGATLTIVCPCCPGAGMLTGVGLAERLKSVTVTWVAPEVEAA